jgi:adenine-specific DNA-methyltransferase
MNLNLFNTTNLFEAATHLFKQLGITLNSNTTEPLPLKDVLKHYYKDNDTFKSVDKTYFIGIIDDSVFKVTGMFDKNYSYKEAIEQGEKNYNGLMLFALELNRQPTRTEISELTRAFNRISQKMPVALLLKYIVDKQAVFSIAISERFRYLQNWREGEKVGKVIILRDIHTQNTHAGHTRILQDLVKPAGVNTYAQLHQHWLQVLDISILNKKFFQELSNWYFAVMDKVSFPDDVEKNKEIRNATNLIRLITRVIFIWFLKEKQLVPAYLFSKNFVASILKDFNKNKQSHNYYNAILQNLFFATLNQKIEERKFAKEGSFQTNKGEHGVKNLFRYADLFTIPEKEILELFKDIPFLNGGLFDCLDKLNDEGKTEYVDGFSRNPKKKAIVPDYTFFGKEQEVDLNEVYGTKNKRYTFRGLINILESYKFTVAENTPFEEEIALDPELLGKVFENLLASYNPETQTTARKETGSFYTPREIVNYMVEESLLEYLKQNVKNTCENFETRLRELISYTETPNLFNREETQAIIEAISNCKILDPACGSGAFPMGILHTMVHILQKLDPENQYWKELQRKKAIQETEQAFTIGDKEERAKRLAEINDVFENNASDYGRKLYLIENCIYGIDIQPIAIQIAKLRFFISLVIDQKVDKTRENFGIRSLPNLETKFVAANTLIGLDKPQQLAIRNPNIEQKEKELKQVRHEYFTANTRKKKIDLQKQDKQLRKEIAQLLKADGWQTNTAEQIASFDPYDQNHFANWFDPEWMFGLNEGFDIVIGNPPYVQVSKGIYSSSLFPYSEGKDKGKQNLYKVFVEASYNLVKSNAFSCMIVQSSLLCDLSSTHTRELLIKNTQILKIIEYPKNTSNENARVFESVLQGTCTYLFKKAKPNLDHNLSISIGNDISTIGNLSFEKLNQLSILKLYPDTYYIPLIKKNEAAILKKLALNSSPFSVLMASITQGDLNLTSNASEFSDKKTSVKLYRGRNVHRYILLKDVEDYVNSGFLAEKVKENQKNIFIVLQEITGTTDKYRLHSCLTDKSEKFLFGHTANKILLKDNSLNKPCIAILNSNLMDWLFRKTSTNNHVMGYELKQLPISNNLKEMSLTITSVVDLIILLKHSNKDSSLFERLIDAMVYELYLPEEIKAGGAEVLKHLTNLPELKEGEDEKNLKTIEKVYKELSDPKHPVSIAMQKMQEIEEVKIIEGRK